MRPEVATRESCSVGFVRKVLIEPGGNFVMTRLVQKVERNCIRGCSAEGSV